MPKFNLLFVILFFLHLSASGQTSYLPLHSEEYQLLSRLEAFSGSLAPFNSSLKPISRKRAMDYFIDQSKGFSFSNLRITEIDQFNLSRALSISGEWVESPDGTDGAMDSKKPILKYFYQKQADLIHVHTDDLFLVINPIIYTQGIKENNVSELKYINMRGAELRGRLFHSIGFYSMLADNQERPVSYQEEWANQHDAFPGYDYYRQIKNNNFDLFLARGYLDINVINEHVNLTFGYDKNFIGDGIRSLFLSDFSAPATFLRLRSSLGRFSYQNLFMELVKDYQRGGDFLVPQKYASLHKLDYQANSWLRLGLFESTIFSQSQFNVSYLIPVILWNSVSRALGGHQKTSLGMDFKALAFRQIQLYGQGYFDQIKFNQLGNGYWGNQFGFQLGGQYFDAFTIPNLDAQAEVNVVRPFTYSADNSIQNYTHYNQPLAHPYGADFAELIGVLHYQPISKLYITGKGIYSIRGVDSTHISFGNDIFKTTDLRNGNDHYPLISGEKMTGLYLNVNVAYELRPRMFLELGATHLKRSMESGFQLPSSTSFYGGLRWNFSRREFDTY